jgi:hypothetical protein
MKNGRGGIKYRRSDLGRRMVLEARSVMNEFMGHITTVRDLRDDCA